ncbi:PAQR family membrane homeostasis protein TrhA [Tateyamaria pelophila]|uniref:PAQR family membrane homeostasis protein TrhA n=1 Tax=Tateyamaria pelophila TaxID=328415 RepID=UPI001CBCC2A4|nr:hemolysin III family protein [Tateyamaria pelophila]
MPYPHSSRETLADASVHVIGVVAGLIACTALISHVIQTQPTHQITATTIYAGAVVFALIASALYHLLPWDRMRPTLRRVDHAAIYIKIAATYTPLVVLIGSGFAYAVLAAVWAVALIGAIAKLSFWSPDAPGAIALYLAMGWASLLLIWPMWQSLPGISTGLIVGGGLLYTLGAVFFARGTMRYQNAVWHIFVLSASACFFGAVTLGVSA